MPDKHEFFPHPAAIRRGGFAGTRTVPGGPSTWPGIGADTGEDGEPSDEVIEAHRRMSKLIAKLTCYYSALFGIEADLNMALELADIDRAAKLRGQPTDEQARQREVDKFFHDL
jgi:hypothetical protein